jgi:tetratricopeptide (TPR) repeat protein
MDDRQLGELPSPSLRTLFDRIRPARVGTLVELAPADYRYDPVQRDDVADVRAAHALSGAVASLMPTDPRSGEFAEFGLYIDGREAWERGDPDSARGIWQSLLALPPESRPWRTVSAAFMMGRSYQRTDPAEAMRWFRHARALAAEGYADGLGLANASLGWEARAELDTGGVVRAMALYMEQYVAGDPTAYASLNIAAWKAASRPQGTLGECARDPLARRVLTAWVIAGGDPGPRPDQCPPYGFRAAWCDALAQVSTVEPSEAAMLAWFAALNHRDDLEARWSALASPDSDLLPWLRLRAAVRTGDHGAAMLAVRDVIGAMPANDGKERWTSGGAECGSRRARARGRLGVLLVSAGRFEDALEEFVAAGQWSDAAYLAERVLTEDEVRCFVDALADGHLPEAQACPGSWRTSCTVAEDLRHLLARRLVRAGRLNEALEYMPVALRPYLAEFRGFLATGNDMALPAEARAAALLSAARIARFGGMELMGTEQWPDGQDSDGAMPSSDTGWVRARRCDGTLVYATTDELRRVETSGMVPARRFHYRYDAADLAWQAARLMPDDSTATAAALCEAGRWLMYQDPPAAERFYKSLVRRCGNTPVGRAAAQAHWFPAKSKETAG